MAKVEGPMTPDKDNQMMGGLARDLHVLILPHKEETNDNGLQRDSTAPSQGLFKKCEALAVSGLTEYGDEIDVIAPTDILKQIFKIPYSKSQLSIAVQRIGDTLILNAGPNVEEEEKLLRRQSNQSSCPDPSIFLNFAMHSVRAEACDCPPAHKPSTQQQESSHGLPGNYGLMEDVYASSTYSHLQESQFLDHNSSGVRNPSHSNKDKYFLHNKMSKQKNTRTDSVKSTSQTGAKPRSPILESEKRRRPGHNDFLRVLFWKFHNFRMLLGSDILLFSNDKYVAVSLHLWDRSRQVTPLTWLEAWLDNVMASVPELAICYHQNGVVQGYELVKTDEIFLLKGVSKDGTPAFHPQVVQQNGLSVLRFLQENCKHDPGAYWLYRSAGEDVIQLFDLSVLPKNHPDDDDNKSPSSILSLMQKGRRDTLFSLGTLLYRIAHRLSLSKAPSNRIKCARFFKKCLDFLHEKDHMVIRAYAHEQFARLILKSYDELELATDTYLLEPEGRVTNLEDEYSEFSFSMFGATGQGQGHHTQITEEAAVKDGDIIPSASSDESVKINLEANSYPQNVSLQALQEARESRHGVLDMCHIVNNSPILVKSVADPISSKLAAVHHVTQAIKSLRWKRQLQNAQGMDPSNRFNERSLTKINLSLCTCGDLNCIEICDIREWLPKAKMDQKMWNLVLLLGESYLVLGEAYKDDEQLHRALKVVELACLVYGSMPQHLDDARYISSLGNGESYQLKVKEGDGIPKPFIDREEDLNFKLFREGFLSDRLFPIYLFWPKAWALVGDVYVEYQRKKGNKAQEQEFDRRSGSDLRVSNEVVREVKRLKKKLGQSKQNCSSCSLINCSCQSDRASSGNSASSSCSGNATPSYRRKHNRKLHSRTSVLLDGNTNGSCISYRSDHLDSSENEHCESSKEDNKHEVSTKPSDECSTVVNNLKASNSFEKDSKHTQAVCHGSRITNISKVVDGGIFRFLEGPKSDDLEFNLKTAMYCYDEARKAMNGFPVDSAEFSSILKRKGWVSNELGRYRLSKKDLASAEIAFDDAILAFKEISDHTNIILINCNLGHGRRSLAEELVSQLDELRGHGILQNACEQAIKTAKS
ncbi:hypothetical protein HPP92_024873 [Vanilla planifolia]|uniref:EDRF1 N-terminal domain-containing protein n=1 Tax=Vanilla planifolia TaxID=51239 RepID=A0A835PKS3_VANPL|nr:hypothetical protein HPP92_024873 [Vanilla planifolia]